MSRTLWKSSSISISGEAAQADIWITALLLPLEKEYFVAHVIPLHTSLLCDALRVMEPQEFGNGYKTEVSSVVSAAQQVYIHQSSGKF